jgi:hypothetical protein
MNILMKILINKDIKMLSFHNDISIKEKYVNRVIKHRELDNIIKGIGWLNGKGCAVGCTLENYNHDRYPIELGIPIWLAKLEDEIFENLPNDESKFWPEIFLKSIPVGVCLEKVKHQLAIIRMDNLLEIQNKLLLKNEKNSEIFLKVINSIELIKKCHELELNNNYCELSNKLTEDLLCSAAESSRSAAESAESAARSAESAESAKSERSAAESAWSASFSAARSSKSAAWSARSAVWSAARSAESAELSAWSEAWKKEAYNLINLLKNCE